VLHLATSYKSGWFGVLSIAEHALEQGIMKTLSSSSLYILSFENNIGTCNAIVILQDAMPPMSFIDILPGTQPTQYYNKLQAWP
jgi:hypothetical protein